MAENATRAEPARKILERFGIDVNEAANEVLVPRNKSSMNPTGAAVHSTLHKEEYYDAVNAALTEATTKDEALEILAQIEQSLESGGFP